MLILASASPRRQELLKLITEDFKIVPADIDESVDKSLPLESVPEHLADQKAAFVSTQYPDDIVIGCDTGVFVGNRMLGKPHGDMAAFEMLRLLSGKVRYRETHNAVLDALDELSIMRLLGIPLSSYIPLC